MSATGAARVPARRRGARRGDGISFVRNQRECEKAVSRDGTGFSVSGGRLATATPGCKGGAARCMQPQSSCLNRAHHHYHQHTYVLIASDELVGINWSRQLTRALSRAATAAAGRGEHGKVQSRERCFHCHLHFRPVCYQRER